ncbi:hypothetical protein ACFV9C_43870 [Kribbella sp. NPDC059898]|uniref:hypothetical protein n=1 Tax=Kribbella sp. NPDC059898 TaxID=3346995 RepID=UPI0036585ACD
MRKLGAATVIVVAICAAAGGIPAVAADNPPSQSTDTSDQATLRSGRSFEKIRPLIPRDAYAGAYLDTSSGTLRVMVTKVPQLPALDPQVDAPVELVTVRYTLEYLDQRMAQVFAAASKLGDADSQIVTVDVNEAKNTLEVAVDGPITSSLRERIAQVAPDTPLELVPGPPLVPGVAHYTPSRVADFAPWSSGTFIYNPSIGGICTSGPGVKIGSTEYMLTAGHCASATGQQIQQGDPDVIPPPLPVVGNVANRSGYPNLDAMLITANVSNTMYRTWYNFYSVDSTPWESLTGQTVCTGGAFSGERCNLSVGATNYCSKVQNSCGLTLAYRSGYIAAGEGDSGGPVYILAPGLRYSGIVTGPRYTTDNFDCPSYPSGIRSCSSYIVFTRIQNTLGYFGASLVSS